MKYTNMNRFVSSINRIIREDLKTDTTSNSFINEV